MAISDLLKGLNKPSTPACSANSEKGSTKILDLALEGEMVDWSPPFEDKFGRGHHLSWVKCKNPQTGHLHDALCNLQWWDPLLLERAKGLLLALEPGSNFSRVCGWERQPEELKQAVIARLEDPSLIEQTTAPLVTEEVEPVERVEIDNGAMHPCIPAMNQIIAAVGREAKASGLVAAGYVYVDPAVFFK